MSQTLTKKKAAAKSKASTPSMNPEGWHVSYTAMADGNKEECVRAEEIIFRYKEGMCDRVLAYLDVLHEGERAEQVDRYEHSLQTATRALRDGQNDEIVVAGLLHDIGDALSSYNHGEFAAAMIRPFVSPNVHWLIANHGVFQGYYYFHFMGKDRNEREKFRGHPAYQLTVDFCEKYDQNSFDPNYDTMPLSAFEPVARRLMAREPWGSHTKV